jgi:magnesium transporter
MAESTAHNMKEPVGLYSQRKFTTLKAEQTVQSALESLRGQDLAEKIVYFYVVDSQHRLVGVVPVRRLLMSKPEALVAAIMVRNVVSVFEDETLLNASELILEKRFMALPVVSRDMRMVGVIDLTLFTEDAAQVAFMHEREDIFQLIGVNVSMHRQMSAFAGFRFRFPWLLCNVGAGLICALIVGANEHLITLMTVLSFFIPVVLALAESVSMQSTTLALQGLYHRRHSWALVWRALRREASVAVLLGLGAGTVVGLFAFAWKGQLPLAAAVGSSIAFSIVAACVLGVVIPGLIRALKVDPKISSGPLVLAIADVATLLLFFTLAGKLAAE